MTIRFAAAKSSIRGRMGADEVHMAMALPANDNVALQGNDNLGNDNLGNDTMVHAALRHFAEHGLAAAHHARKQAEEAGAEGDAQSYDYWLEICRALDRRMARELVKRTADKRLIGG